MTKKGILEFLKPFNDNIEITVKSSKSMAPYTYELKHVPPTADFDAHIVILQKGSVVVGVR